MSEELLVKWDVYQYDFDKKNDDEDDESAKLPQILQTPFGLFRADDTLNPFRQFNFWIANTNFNLGKKAKASINNVSGVESLVFLTRYRFIIGIGKLFNPAIVRKAVEDALTGKNKTEILYIYDEAEANEKLIAIQKKLDTTYHYWAIYAFPNGNLDYYSDANLPNVITKYQFYKTAQVYSRGRIIISNKLKEQLSDEKYNKRGI